MRQWVDNNLDNPYPSQSTLKELSIETQKSEREIADWIKKRRSYVKKNEETYQNRMKEKTTLECFFENFTNDPNLSQIEYLGFKLNKSPKQIKTWFIRERFKRRKQSQEEMLY